MTNEKSIYDLELHEIMGVVAKSQGVALPCIGIMRVPGGWIYFLWDEEKHDYTRELFVPFHNEFQTTEKLPFKD